MLQSWRDHARWTPRRLLGHLGESWRTWQTVAVLSAWAIAGTLLAPGVLRRMARRQSGTAVAEARETAAQWIR